MHRWRENRLGSTSMDSARDDRRLNLAAKPNAITDRDEGGGSTELVEDHLISLIRRTVNEAFVKLPNFRAKEVTSLFHSTSKPIKWVPESVVAAEIGYEEGRESYSDLHVDGKLRAEASVDSDYIRSWDKAWSTGDFETISHCVFSELEDSDFRRVRTERTAAGDLVVYEFAGGRSSACIGVKYRSQIAYPAYKGLLKVKAQTREVLHVELEATEMPAAFPLDRAERSVDFGTIHIGTEQYLLPTTAYWFGCFRNSYSCFLNRMDFRDYRRFDATSIVRFGN